MTDPFLEEIVSNIYKFIFGRHLTKWDGCHQISQARNALRTVSKLWAFVLDRRLVSVTVATSLPRLLRRYDDFKNLTKFIVKPVKGSKIFHLLAESYEDLKERGNIEIELDLTHTKGRPLPPYIESFRPGKHDEMPIEFKIRQVLSDSRTTWNGTDMDAWTVLEMVLMLFSDHLQVEDLPTTLAELDNISGSLWFVLMAACSSLVVTPSVDPDLRSRAMLYWNDRQMAKMLLAEHLEPFDQNFSITEVFKYHRDAESDERHLIRPVPPPHFKTFEFITSLSVAGRVEVFDFHLYGMPCVRKLDLRNCSHLTDPPFMEFSQLEDLKIDGCWRLTDQAVDQVANLSKDVIVDWREPLELRSLVEVVILSPPFEGFWVSGTIEDVSERTSPDDFSLADIYVHPTASYRRAIGFSGEISRSIRRRYVRRIPQDSPKSTASFREF